MLPGVGLKDDINAARDLGVSICRIATHCTEADISIQHFGLARELGLETVGFLMMAHTIRRRRSRRQARIMADAGCQCVYVVDSAGALILDQVATGSPRSSPSSARTPRSASTATRTSRSGVANSVLAIRAGAVQIDGSTPAFRCRRGQHAVRGAGRGLSTSSASQTGIDVLALIDAAEDVVRPVMDEECAARPPVAHHGLRGGLLELPQARRARGERYGVPAHEILLRAGERKLVGGQEDQLIDIALEIKREQSVR